jgi:palmitoyl-protein thioesterase
MSCVIITTYIQTMNKRSCYLYMFFMIYYIINIQLTCSNKCNYLPTILVHGIASNKNELTSLSTYLTEYGVPTYNIEIGNGVITSAFVDMNKQCEEFAYKIKEIKLSGKINIIGISQGGLIARCYTEKYSNTINELNTLMTMGTPHMGYYNDDLSISTPSANGYIKNPFLYETYIEKNNFLAYINNEKQHSDFDLYKKNIERVGRFVIVWSGIDKVIVPRESSKFEYYSIEQAVFNKSLIIIPLEQSNVFKNDVIGIKTLYTNNKLLIYRFDCEHDMFKNEICFIGVFNSTLSFLCGE